MNKFNVGDIVYVYKKLEKSDIFYEYWVDGMDYAVGKYFKILEVRKDSVFLRIKKMRETNKFYYTNYYFPKNCVLSSREIKLLNILKNEK